MESPRMIFLTILALAFLFTSCDEQEIGIFYSIEQERKLGDNILDNNLTAGKLLVKDIDNDGKMDYLLAAGKVYNVVAADNSQHTVQTEGEWQNDYAIPSDKLCLRIFDINDTIYGLLFAKNQDEGTLMDTHLYSLNVSAKEWNLLTDGGLDQKIIEDAEAAGEVLYYSTYTQEEVEGDIRRTYSLGYYDPSKGTDRVGSIPNLGTLHPSGYLDASAQGGTIYLTYGEKIFSGSTPSTIKEVAPEASSLANIMDGSDSSSQSTAFQGIHYSSLYSTFYLSTADGSLWYLGKDDNGGDKWLIDTKISDSPFDFADYSLEGKDLLLVGSENGYYEKSGTLTDSDFTSPSVSVEKDTYITLDLQKAVINDLFVYKEDSSNEGVLFALTSGYGLWANRNVDGTRIWNQE